MLPKSIHIREVGPREGVQSEDRMIATADKIALADALARTGLRSLELVAFVSPEWVPAMADAEAVLSGIQRVPGVRYSGIYLNVRGLERALQADCVVDGSLTLSASETFSRRNTNKGTAETLAALPAFLATYKRAGIAVHRINVIAAFGCNFEGHVPLERLMTCIEQLLRVATDHGETIASVNLFDTMGWANPEQIQRTIDAVGSAWPDLEPGLHLHDTRGLGLANADAALRAGVRRFDSAIGGLGGCPFAAVKGAPGNIATEDFVFLCEEMGVATGVDLDALIECVALAERIFGRTLPGRLSRGGLFRAQRPVGWAPAVYASQGNAS